MEALLARMEAFEFVPSLLEEEEVPEAPGQEVIKMAFTNRWRRDETESQRHRGYRPNPAL